MAMEVSLSCNSASVTVLDTSFAPIVEFNDVPIIGSTGLCSNGFGKAFAADPGRDFRSR